MTTLWYPIIILISQIKKPRPERLSWPKSLELVSGKTKIQILSDRIQELFSSTQLKNVYAYIQSNSVILGTLFNFSESQFFHL